MIDSAPILLSLKLATVVTILLLVLAVPLAYFLAFTRSRWKAVMEAVTALPIVLPPTVIGFYLLMMLSERSALGRIASDTFGLPLVFSFTGLVVASCVYSLPFMVQPLQSGFEHLNRSIIEASYTLGKSKWQTLLRVMLPNMRPSIITAIVITFAHTIGEFGVVLMVGGSIPGVTRVAAVAIYDEVEALNYSGAHVYSAILVAISFVVLLTVYVMNKRIKEGQSHD